MSVFSESTFLQNIGQVIFSLKRNHINAEVMEVFVVSTHPSVFVGLNLHTVEEDFASKAMNHHIEGCEAAGWFAF